MKCQPGWCSVVNTGITTCIHVGTESEAQFLQLHCFDIHDKYYVHMLCNCIPDCSYRCVDKDRSAMRRQDTNP